ncbi:hypothetical protein D3C72_879550 [compost metagenome]
MTDRTTETSQDRTGLTNYEALEIAHAMFKRWGEIRLRDIEADMAKVRAEGGDEPGGGVEARFNALFMRAKWHKRVDLMLEAEGVFDKRYGSPKGELKLIQEMFGEQLGLSESVTADDVKQRLDWYQRRAAIDYVRDVQTAIDDHKVTSPIEQIFLMEWLFLRVNDRFGVRLIPQHKITVGDISYRVDFVVTKENSPIKVAVELDGHDFHEKTREQVRKDKERERTIVRQGYTMLRFTGSEVVKDPRKCVEEVADVLANL